MTQPDPASDPANDPAQDQGADPSKDTRQGDPKDDTDWKAEARKWEARAKENQTAVKAAEAERRKSMTEAERSVAEAEERGRTSAITEFGRDLARERFDALAGRRNPDINTSNVLEFVDLGKFLDESGRPDNKAIEAAVKRLVPEAVGAPSYEGGSRQPASPNQSFSDTIRRAAGRS